MLGTETLSKNEVLGKESYLEIAQKNYEEMFGEDLPERDRLYGTHLAVEYELLDENGNGVLINGRVPGRFNDNFYVYRWIDAVGEGKAFGIKDAAAVFHEKTDEGLGEFKPQKEVDLFVPASVQTNFTWMGSPDFTAETVSNNKVLFEYNPDLSDVEANKIVQKPITIEVNKGVKIGQIAASFQPHLRFDDYWIPSTDSLDLHPDSRDRLFRRIFRNRQVTKFYLDVLASKGPTVDFDRSGLANNILQSDSMNDFYFEIEKRLPENTTMENTATTVVPWFEGTGRIAYKQGLYNEYNIDGDNGPIFNTQDGYLYHIDLFTNDVAWNIFRKYVDAFVDEYKPDFKFQSIIVDDHFGISAKVNNNVDIMKSRLKSRKTQFQSESNDVVLKRGLVDLVSDRVEQLSEILWAKGIALSVSVNPFTFRKAGETDPNLEERDSNTKERNLNAWHNALKTNYHDVAKWIEEGYIRGDLGGEINVQIYREDPDEVIRLYDELRNDLLEHLDGKTTDYFNRFPKIAVSLAAEGNTGTDGRAWTGNRKNIAKILDYINKDRNNIVRIDDTREFKIRVSAFDGDDFHTLPA